MALDRLFQPRSIAVIGAAREPGKVGYEVLSNLLAGGFDGPVYPVNPHAEEIIGVPAFKSVSAIDREVDLAVVVVPARAVADVVRECVRIGVGATIVISAGFRETGRSGGALEHEIVRIARSGDLRLLGPNCLGVISTRSRMNASFARSMPPAGGISFLSQSGALGTAILEWAEGEGAGVANFVSLGNRADISEVDLFEAWATDEETRVIAGYLESVADGEGFLRAAARAAERKPVVLLKAGTSEAGARAVSSHTGSLAGSDTAYEAALRATGVERASTVQELFDLASAYSRQPVPAGGGVAILTNAGGPAVLATDRADDLGCSMASLERSTITRLREVLPEAAALYNPVDILGDAPASRYAQALAILREDPGVRSVLVILTPQAMSQPELTADAIVRQARDTKVPVVTCFMGHASVQEARAILRSGDVPDFPFPERAIAAVAALERRALRSPVRAVHHPPDGVDISTPQAVVRTARAEGRTLLAEERAAAVVASFGVPVPAGACVSDLEDALDAAERIGYPVALKIAGPEIVHKSDIGGIRVGIAAPDELRSAYNDILDRARTYARHAVIDGMHIQKMVEPGREVIIGIDRDPVFGPLLMFGLGGVYVEVMRDVTFRLCPVDAAQARAMISEIRAFGLLKGTRGETPADLDAVIDVLVRVSHMADMLPELVELDINPLIVGDAGEGAWAADVRIGIGGTG